MMMNETPRFFRRVVVPREDMRRAVFEYIEVDYNRTMRHSANGYISPLSFESKMAA
jgi:transposase InsO family protein